MKMYSALFDNIHPSNCGAVASARRADHLFPRLAPQHQQGNQRKSDDSVTQATLTRRNRETAGRLDDFGGEVQTSMVVCMRQQRRGFEQQARDDHDAALAAHRARDAATIQEAKGRLVRSYIKARNSFGTAPIVSDDDLRGRASVKSLESKVTGNLAQQKSGNTRAKVLKENIQRYVNDTGLTQFDPGFYTASDPSSEKGESGSEKNVAWLKKTLINIYDIVKKEKIELPGEAAVPEMHTRTLPGFGVPTFQRVSIENGVRVDKAELDKLADEQITAPRAPGKLRRSALPMITDSIVGKKVGVAWNLTYNLPGGRTATDVFW